MRKKGAQNAHSNATREHGRWWLFRDASSYHDAKLAAADGWPLFLLAFRDLQANQRLSTTPPGWVHEAGQETLVGNWVGIPVGFLNSKREQQQRNMTQWLPRDTTTAQSAALQAALAASMRAAQGK